MSVVLGRVNNVWAIYIQTFQSLSQTCERSASEFIRHVNVQFLSRKWVNMNPAAIVLSCRHTSKLAQITISCSSIIINTHSVLIKEWPSQQLSFTAKKKKTYFSIPNFSRDLCTSFDLSECKYKSGSLIYVHTLRAYQVSCNVLWLFVSSDADSNSELLFTTQEGAFLTSGNVPKNGNFFEKEISICARVI
jgi:hypothetical protein